MSSFAPIDGLMAEADVPMGARLGPDVLARRMTQRRQNLIIHFGSNLITATIISVFAFEGGIPWFLPLAFTASAASITAVFLVLSQSGFNDRFEDHYLTLWQMAANTISIFVFILIAPQIGYVFVCSIYLVFSYAALRLTIRQAIISWTLLALCMIPIFLGEVPITISITTMPERLGALLVFTATVGQCTFIGLYGNGLRKQLYQSSVALRTAYKRIEELAETDELTGAFNRRSIMRKLYDEVARAKRLAHPCSIALIDLDFFKRINDTFGHPAGDEVLRTFAITAFANIRGIDVFGRYGGEEFLLVLPETPHHEAERILNRMRIIVSDLDWSALSPGMSLSISAGIATLMPNETPDEMLVRADGALYAAKRNGRNRIASAV